MNNEWSFPSGTNEESAVSYNKGWMDGQKKVLEFLSGQCNITTSLGNGEVRFETKEINEGQINRMIDIVEKELQEEKKQRQLEAIRKVLMDDYLKKEDVVGYLMDEYKKMDYEEIENMHREMI